MQKVLTAALTVAVALSGLLAGQPVQAATPAPWQQATPFGTLPATASDKLAPALRATLAITPDTAMITAIVTLKAQADLSAITTTDPVVRQQQIIHTLQTQAASTQAPFAGEVAGSGAGNAIDRIVPFWIFNGFSITATPATILALADRPDVLSVNADAVSIVPAAAAATPEPNLTIVNTPALWALGRFGQGVVVASMDTGADLSNPDLAASWRGGNNSWFDPYGEHPTTPADLNGHGTNIMGVIVGGQAGGTAVGVAPQATWIAVKIFNDHGTSSATAIHQGFQWLLDPDHNPNTADSPQVVNNSWTFATPGCDLSFEPDLQALRAAGILPVFAAGNSGPTLATSISPANNPSALAVGATDNNDAILAGSSRGPTACGQSSKSYPDLTAPGWNIRTSGLSGGYMVNSGTSLAAPHVAGALALLLGIFPGLSAADQQAALTHSAVDRGVPGADNDYGAGRLDILGAYQWLLSGGFTPQSVTPIIVNTTADTIAADGLCTLREAVIAANSDGAFGGCVAGAGADTILFAPALSSPATIALTTTGANEDSALTGDLDVAGTLAISGTVTVDGADADRIFDILPGAHVAITGLTVRNGNTGLGDGGGIRIQGALNLTNVALTANRGGGANNLGGSLTLSNTAVTGNTAFGIANQGQGVLVVNGGALGDNQGSGVVNSQSTATLNGVTVSGNTGSGIVNQGSAPSKLSVTASTVISNSATSGAGIANEGVSATAIIVNSRIGVNRAVNAGGGVFNNGLMSIAGSTIDHNEARTGGGVEHFGGNLSLTNVTISGNSVSDNGGGIYNLGSLTAKNVTIALNGAGGSGGNIYHDQGQAIYGGMLVANPAGGDNCGRNAGQINSNGNNLESTNTCSFVASTDLPNADPKLGPLQANGGPTWTHALTVGSPAIDAIPVGINGCGSTLVADQRGVARPLGAACDIGAFEGSFMPGAVTPIHAIQGAAHTSPLAGQTLMIEGAVTAVRDAGFFVQDAVPDSDDATSEGIFVATSVAPAVAVGDHVSVSGQVVESEPGGPGSNLLTVTTLVPGTVSVLEHGLPLPAPVIIGAGGRVPPATILEDDAFALFDPAQDGLDFFESLEGMRVQVNDAVVIGATDSGGDLWVLADGGAGAGPRTARGGLYATASDANPERIRLNGALAPGGALPTADVGMRFLTPVVGIMDYPAVSYAILVMAALTADPANAVTPESTTLAGDAQSLTVATVDANNLGGDTADATFTEFANLIVNRLHSPDIVTVDGMLDDSGSVDDGVTAAGTTFARLITAIQAAGGPGYTYRQVDPADGQDGGVLGGNGRIGFLFNPARVNAGGSAGDYATANSIVCAAGVPDLALNPGRIDPGNVAYADNRKPLAMQFSLGGVPFFVIAVHFLDNTQDTPFFGSVQPSLLASQAQRIEQAQAVHDFAASILACDAQARVVIAGNTYSDRPDPAAVTALGGTIFTDLMNTLAPDARSSAIIDGSSLALDQMLVSDRFVGTALDFDIVHANAEFATRLSDHDPSLARFSLTGSGSLKHLFVPLVRK